MSEKRRQSVTLFSHSELYDEEKPAHINLLSLDILLTTGVQPQSELLRPWSQQLHLLQPEDPRSKLRARTPPISTENKSHRAVFQGFGALTNPCLLNLGKVGFSLAWKRRCVYGDTWWTHHDNKMLAKSHRERQRNTTVDHQWRR